RQLRAIAVVSRDTDGPYSSHGHGGDNDGRIPYRLSTYIIGLRKTLAEAYRFATYGKHNDQRRWNMDRRRILAKALGALGALLAVITVVQFRANATPPSGLVNVPLARGTNVSNGTIALQVGTDVAMAQITVDPGGSSGWHSHPG